MFSEGWFYAGISSIVYLPGFYILEMMNSILRLHYENTFYSFSLFVLNFRCIEGMSLMAVIYNFNLYFVIYGSQFSYSSHLKLCYVFYILLCNLNCVILSCSVCTCVLYYCDLFHIQLSCNSFDLQNVYWSLTSELDAGEWSISHTGNFTPKGRGPGTHRIGGCVVPAVGLDILKTKISCTCLDINSRSPSP